MKSDENHRPDEDATYRRTVRAVQAVLEFDLGDSEEEFDWGFGRLVGDMHDALAAIHRAGREQLACGVYQTASTREAAASLVRIAAAIDHTIVRGQELCDD
jgi:hypothetical protein